MIWGLDMVFARRQEPAHFVASHLESLQVPTASEKTQHSDKTYTSNRSSFHSSTAGGSREGASIRSWRERRHRRQHVRLTHLRAWARSRRSILRTTAATVPSNSDHKQCD